MIIVIMNLMIFDNDDADDNYDDSDDDDDNDDDEDDDDGSANDIDTAIERLHKVKKTNFFGKPIKNNDNHYC